MIRDHADEWRREVMLQCEDIVERKATRSLTALTLNLKKSEESSKVFLDSVDKIV